VSGRLAEACERFGIAYDTAAQATRVAAAFESCMRIQDLTFNHHQIVANHPQAGELLEWAAESGSGGIPEPYAQRVRFNGRTVRIGAQNRTRHAYI
jgi:hypothetical protein